MFLIRRIAYHYVRQISSFSHRSSLSHLYLFYTLQSLPHHRIYNLNNVSQILNFAIITFDPWNISIWAIYPSNRCIVSSFLNFAITIVATNLIFESAISFHFLVQHRLLTDSAVFRVCYNFPFTPSMQLISHVNYHWYASNVMFATNLYHTSHRSSLYTSRSTSYPPSYNLSAILLNTSNLITFFIAALIIILLNLIFTTFFAITSMLLSIAFLNLLWPLLPSILRTL